jgi:hypothetical protein
MGSKSMMIDPPSGWRYGFPKVLTKKSDELLKDWLVRMGYPAKDAEWAAENCRYWNEKDEIVSV